MTDFEAYLRSTRMSLPTCLALVKVTDMNAAAMELFETQELADLQRFPYIAEPAACELGARHHRRSRNRNIASQQREGTIRTLRGLARSVVTRTTVVPGFETTLSRIVTALIDVTEREQAGRRFAPAKNASASYPSTTTSLAFSTGAISMTRSRPCSAVASGPCSLLFMDLDQFKSVVD